MDDRQGQAPSSEDRGGKGDGPGTLWLMLAPVACCGGPLLFGVLAAADALAWGAFGLGVALAAAVALTLVLRRRRRSRECCPPAPDRPARAAGTSAGLRAR